MYKLITDSFKKRGYFVATNNRIFFAIQALGFAPDGLVVEFILDDHGTQRRARLVRITVGLVGVNAGFAVEHVHITVGDLEDVHIAGEVPVSAQGGGEKGMPHVSPSKNKIGRSASYVQVLGRLKEFAVMNIDGPVLRLSAQPLDPVGTGSASARRGPPC